MARNVTNSVTWELLNFSQNRSRALALFAAKYYILVPKNSTVGDFAFDWWLDRKLTVFWKTCFAVCASVFRRMWRDDEKYKKCLAVIVLPEYKNRIPKNAPVFLNSIFVTLQSPSDFSHYFVSRLKLFNVYDTTFDFMKYLWCSSSHFSPATRSYTRCFLFFPLFT